MGNLENPWATWKILGHLGSRIPQCRSIYHK
nr:MAG TPA: hypothetical protein [Caudoviricetes sp.]